MLRIVASAKTFDDLLLVPRRSSILPDQADTSVVIGGAQGMRLRIPLLSAASDTVTEHALAIALARLGGLGVIHRNNTPAEQAEQVEKVKTYEAGIIRNPVTTTIDTKVSALRTQVAMHNFSGMVVVDGGSGKVQGIVTQRDFRYLSDKQARKLRVGDVMTPLEKLITVPADQTEDARRLLVENRVEKLPVLAKDGTLAGLITFRDVLKAETQPNRNVDEEGRLRVAAAVGTLRDQSFAERVEKLTQAGVDMLVIDSAHGHAEAVIETAEHISTNYPEAILSAGNVVTADGAKALRDAGAHVVKVGIGPGSICTTRIVTGVGVPQLTAVDNVAGALADSDISIVADGGIRYSGDIAKALAAGAHAVMIGGMLAGTDEAPGELILTRGGTYKSYRGMGSQGAMQHRAEISSRYMRAESSKLVAEGVEGRVPYKGPLSRVVEQLIGGLQNSMGYLGCANIAEMHQHAEFVEISNSGVSESHVHDLEVTKDAPNYRAPS